MLRYTSSKLLSIDTSLTIVAAFSSSEVLVASVWLTPISAWYTTTASTNNTFYAGWADKIETTLRVFLLPCGCFISIDQRLFFFFLCVSSLVFVVPLDRINKDLVWLECEDHSQGITNLVFSDQAHQCCLATLEELATLFYKNFLIIHKLLHFFEEMFCIQSNAFVRLYLKSFRKDFQLWL